MKKFNWDLPADPDPKSDNYYNGIVSKELKAPSNVGEVLLGVIHRELVTNQSDFVNEGFSLFLTGWVLKPTSLSQERRSSWHSSGLKLAQCGRGWWKTKVSQNQLHPTLSKLS